MSDVHVRLRAWQPGAGSLGLLPDPLSLSASVGREAGAMTVEYSRLRRGGDLLARGLDQGMEVGLEISRGSGPWVEPLGCRYLLLKRTGDQLDDADTVRLTLPSYGWLMGKARFLDDAGLDEDGRRAFEGATPGAIVHALLAENAGRGGIALSASSFSAATDSAGQPWAGTVSASYDVGTDLATLVEKLSEQGVIDWATDGRNLRVWNAEAVARDLTGSVRLHLGRDITQAPDDESLEEVVGRVLVKGDDGLRFIETTSDSPSPWGVWEGYISQAGIADAATAQRFARHELDRVSRVRGQYTRTLRLSADRAVPLLDYTVTDYIAAPTTSRAPMRTQVQQITITRDAAGVGAALVLGDKIVDLEVRRAKRLAAIGGGVSGMGGSGGGGVPIGPIPSWALPSTPSPPTGLGIDERVEVPEGDYAAHSRVTFDWQAPTTNVDGTPLTDLAGFEVQWDIDYGARTLGMVSLSPETLSLDATFTAYAHVRAMVRAVNSRGTASEWASFLFFPMSYGDLDRAHIWGNLRDGVDQLGSRADANDARDNGQDSRLDSLERSDQTTDSEQAIQDGRLDALEQSKTDKLENGHDQWRQDQQRRAGDEELAKRISQAEAEAERRKQEAQAEARRRAKIEQRQAQGEEWARQYRKALEEYARRMADAERDGAGLTEGHGKLRKRVDHLEDDVRRLRGDGDTISRWAESAEAEKEAQRGFIGQLFDWVDDLFGESTDHAQKGWRHDSAILALRDVDTAQDGRLGSVEGEISTARGVHPTLGSRLGGMDGVSSGLGTRVSAAEGSIGQHRGWIDTLWPLLAEMSAARGGHSELNGRLNAVGSRLNEQEGWINTLWPLLGRMTSAENALSGKASVSSVSDVRGYAEALRDALKNLADYTNALRQYINNVHGASLPGPPTIPP